MIYTDSRYATGVIAKTIDARTKKPGVTVFREYPSANSEFYYYTWTEKDRIDDVAGTFMGDPSLWWIIMDYNPEYSNPLNIPIGSLLRIPGGQLF